MSGHISQKLCSKTNKKSSKKNTERTKKTTKKTHKTRNTEIETERVLQDLQDSLQTSTSGNSNLVNNTERCIFEEDANEPQVLVDIENRLEKNSNNTNNK